MSLAPRLHNEIPEETARVAKAIYPKGNLFMKLRDELGEIFTDEMFADLYPQMGRRGLSPSRLALVTLMQYIADYSDRQAAEAVRDQISWKYTLGLELEDQGFDYSILSEFRQRLVAAQVQERLFNAVLDKLKAKGLLKGSQQQRTDATHVLARVRQLNRLELLGETVRVALNRLAQIAPTWLESHVPHDWFDRYAQRFNTWHLPQAAHKRQALVQQIGQDGYSLLNLVYQHGSPFDLGKLAEIEALRQIWLQQFWLDENDELQLRQAQDMPKGAQLIQSPFDLEARFSQERAGKKWLGYKTHLTETCAAAAPRIISDVQTGLATENDSQRSPKVQQALCEKGLQPAEHYLDIGYASVPNLVSSMAKGIVMLTPMRANVSWQAQTTAGLGLNSFFIDWEQQVVRCPNGNTSQVWSEAKNTNQLPVIHIRFAAADCQSCPLKANCTQGVARSLKLYPRDWHEALVQARQRQASPDFKSKYRIRAGVEGTISLAVRRCDLRHSPFIGLQKTNLHCLNAATALNVMRAINWLNDVPLATTRKSPLHLLVA